MPVYEFTWVNLLFRLSIHLTSTRKHVCSIFGRALFQTNIGVDSPLAVSIPAVLNHHIIKIFTRCAFFASPSYLNIADHIISSLLYISDNDCYFLPHSHACHRICDKCYTTGCNCQRHATYNKGGVHSIFFKICLQNYSVLLFWCALNDLTSIITGIMNFERFVKVGNLFLLSFPISESPWFFPLLCFPLPDRALAFRMTCLTTATRSSVQPSCSQQSLCVSRSGIGQFSGPWKIPQFALNKCPKLTFYDS